MGVRDAGHVRSAEGEVDDLPEPLALREGEEAPSVVLAALRRDER